MSDEEKWKRERSVVESFLSLLGIAEPELHRPDGPHPDVVWKDNGRMIGIEVTRLLSEQDLVRAENVRDDICSRARDLLQPDLPDCYVWVHWHDGQPTVRASRQSLSEEIRSRVLANVPPSGGRTVLGFGYDADVEYLHSAIDRIAIDRTVAHGGTYVETTYSTWATSLSASALQARIEEKNSRERGALNDIDEHWLVLYGGFGPLSSWVDFEDGALAQKFAAKFDRVYVAMLNLGTVAQLQIVSAATDA